MNCKKCENVLAEGSKFCGKCGEKVTTEVLPDVKKDEEKFESKDINEMKSHLEFLGYSTEFVTDNPKQVILTAIHSSKPNAIVSSTKNNVVFLNSTWKGLKEVNSVEQYRHLNKLMETTNTLSQLVINKDGDLNIFSTYVGEYDKKRFGEFFEIFINDINRTLNDETFKGLFTK